MKQGLTSLEVYNTSFTNKSVPSTCNLANKGPELTSAGYSLGALEKDRNRTSFKYLLNELMILTLQDLWPWLQQVRIQVCSNLVRDVVSGIVYHLTEIVFSSNYFRDPTTYPVLRPLEESINTELQINESSTSRSALSLYSNHEQTKSSDGQFVNPDLIRTW